MAFAHGATSPGCMSTVMLLYKRSPPAFCHRPDRSGLPSVVRGAGAARFGFPSGRRGMPGVGSFSHWASSIALAASVRQTNDSTNLFAPRTILVSFDVANEHVHGPAVRG